ncbi:MAG: endonuclease domain-containing protein [Clostridia bacterium]|nr:endonuclease domain-containing protein [Clostridia bacterium]
MTYDYNKKLIPNAKNLRKNMTAQEKKLWYQFLNKLPVRVKRQKVIGEYIVDFYCSQTKTVIEIDGSQHFEDENKAKDIARDNYLNSLGITVLRYDNKTVNENFKGVCTDILKNFNLL